MSIHEIPGKLTVTWNDQVKAIVDTWQDYFVTKAQFQHAVLGAGMDHAKAHGGIAWIVDGSRATGAFTQEIQDFIETDIFPAFAANGIKYFISIPSQVSAVTRLTIHGYTSKVGPAGITLVEADSAVGAVEWLKNEVQA